MVKLEIEEYCNECPDFEAKSETNVVWENGMPSIVETIVTCENRRKCRCIYNTIKRSTEKSNAND